MFKDFSEPSLKNAIDLLRTPSEWPTNFGPWDYVHPCTCAMGLFRTQWGRTEVSADSVNTAKLLGISSSQGEAIFARLGHHHPVVTPDLVADELEKLLA